MQIYPTLGDTHDKEDVVLEHWHRHLGGQPFRYSARIGADLLGYAAPEIGDVLTEKNKTFAKDVGSKTIQKQLGGGKKKVSISKSQAI